MDRVQERRTSLSCLLTTALALTSGFPGILRRHVYHVGFPFETLRERSPIRQVTLFQVGLTGDAAQTLLTHSRQWAQVTLFVLPFRQHAPANLRYQ